MPLKAESDFRLRTRPRRRTSRIRGPRTSSPAPPGLPIAPAPVTAAPTDSTVAPTVKDAGHSRPSGPMAVRPARRTPPTPDSAAADAHPEA